MVSGAFFEIRELSCSIAGSRILDRVSFLVQRGDCVCIVGPNGAGKSTLLKCAGGLIRNFSGQTLLEGAPLLSLKSRLVARRVAWVHQSGADSLPFTVREFARMSRYPWRSALGGETKADEEAVESALAISGVGCLAGRKLGSLSGGERQRSLIAAAIDQGTDMLFLDEPTSFLDYKHQAETLALIEKINKEQNKTILMVTHDVNLALHAATAVVAVRDGRVVWRGGRAELLDKELLKDIFDTEFEIFSSAEGARYVAPRGLMI